MIGTQELIGKAQQTLDEKWGYIWGTSGESWTAAKQEKLNQTTEADLANSRKYGAKWIGHKVTDCSGLFSWAFKQLGGYVYHGSDTMYRKYCVNKGELNNGKRADGQELKPGTAVFTYSTETGKRGHVGLYIGNGYVIEARGAYYGVVKTKLTDRPWVEWGELKDVDYSGSGTAPSPQPEPAKTRPTVRKGNRNVYVKEMQTYLDKLGYDLGICGIDGDFGTATEKALTEFQRDHGLVQDGVCGARSWSELIAAVEKLNKEPEKKYTVTICGLTADKAKEITQQFGGVISVE